MFDLNSYHKANTVEEAIALLSQNPKAIPIAGGTDVLVRLHQRHPDYRHLVDIHDVAELKEIVMTPDGTIMVGSGATFTSLMESRIITDNIPVLSEGASWVGGPQVRNMATVGGNICNGVPSADSAAPLLVLNAVVVLKGPQDERHVPLHEFYQGPGRVDRQPAEIMTALRIAPDDYRRWSARYYKYAMRDAMDIWWTTSRWIHACTWRFGSTAAASEPLKAKPKMAIYPRCSKLIWIRVPCSAASARPD